MVHCYNYHCSPGSHIFKDNRLLLSAIDVGLGKISVFQEVGKENSASKGPGLQID